MTRITRSVATLAVVLSAALPASAFADPDTTITKPSHGSVGVAGSLGSGSGCSISRPLGAC